MRGNPILRAGLLLAALCLAGLLVAAVVGPSGSRPPNEPASAPGPAPSDQVPTLITITLAAPARSLTFTESSGRVIEVPLAAALSAEHEADLAISGHSWEALLTVTWQEPDRHNFLRLDFEPERLKSSTLTLDFRPHTTEQPISTTFNPN